MGNIREEGEYGVSTFLYAKQMPEEKKKTIVI